MRRKNFRRTSTTVSSSAWSFQKTPPSDFSLFFECADDRYTLKLDKLYLKPDFHGRGIGSKVLQYLTECASDAGYKAICLNVNKENVRAIRAYSKNGFKKKASVKIDIGSGFFMDDFIMEKKIM